MGGYKTIYEELHKNIKECGIIYFDTMEQAEKAWGEANVRLHKMYVDDGLIETAKYMREHLKLINYKNIYDSYLKEMEDYAKNN